MAKLNWSGSCKKAKWLTFGRMSRPACGMVAAIYSVWARLIASSWSPSTTRTGVSIVFELGVGPVGLDEPHLADLIDEGGVFVRRRRERGVFLARARDESGEGRVLLDILDDARGPGVGGEGEHLADPVLVPEREVDADDAAVAPADDVRLRDLERVHQRHDVVGHQIVAVRPRVARRAAVAAAVHQDHGVARRDRGNLIAPIVAVGETAVQENDRRAAAIDRVVDLDAVGLGLAAAVG